MCRLCLDLIPHVLDDGDIEAAAALSFEAERSMPGDGDPGPFYGPVIRLGRARVRLAQDDPTAAAQLVLDSLPARVAEAPTVSQVLSALEVAAMVMAASGDRRARRVMAAIDRWQTEAHMVENPIVDERRDRALAGLPPMPSGDPIDLDHALAVAGSALAV